MDNEESEKQNGLSRREFLKNAGIVIGGVALASLAFSAACTSAEINTSAGNTTSDPTTSPTAVTSISATASTSDPPPSTSTPTSVTSTVSTVPVGVTSTATVTSSSFLIPIPGCSTFVATDRLYSADDNVWVKNLGGNLVQLGISDTYQSIVAKVDTCSLLPTGTILQAEQPFGSIEAEKLNVDLTSPVSGAIVAINSSITAIPLPINVDPYGSGWMVNVQLSNPAELNNLVSAEYYAYLESPAWTGPVPSMH